MANRLQSEISPYLLQHADNPVDWYPWGEEAFQEARRKNKPVFLSIGYAACHWCHVMAHESFEDPETAQIMNRGFVNIKVDREERPDVDSIYMNAVVAMTGHGGWPLSIFLTPQAKPFYGGTYFPPTRRYNMPSFQEVLLYVQDQWTNHRESVIRNGEGLTQAVQQNLPKNSDLVDLNESILDQAVQMLFRQYDWKNGGWGVAPKFPASSAIELLFLRYHRSKDQLALDMASHALGHMRRGGIFDQVGGGFHRYSVDAQWLIPHFEKMLYDNAMLLRTYLQHWQITGDKSSLELVEGTIAFLVREMKHEGGGYFASLDADSEGEEGTYYLWTEDEIVEACTQSDYPAFATQAFGVTEAGNFEGRNVLFQPLPLVNLANQFDIGENEARNLINDLRRCLLQIREKRVRPAVDDKVVTCWNGLLLIALAEAARALSRPDILALAQELGEFALTRLTVNGKLYRSWRDGEARYTAYLEDHAALGLGLLSLYQADFNPRWLNAARQHAREILEHFSDEQGGFFDTRDDHEELITRPRTLQDTPTPSGAAMAVKLLLQLSALDDGQVDHALKTLAGMQESAGKYPSAFAAWLNALDFGLGPQLQLVVSGDARSNVFADLMRVSNAPYLPRLVRAGGHPEDADAPELLKTRPVEDRGATAYLCENFTCQLPTQDPEKLQAQIVAALSQRGEAGG